MTPRDLIADLRSRINPAYAQVTGTESHERRLCADALEAQADRLEVLEVEHQQFFERWHDVRRKLEALQCAVSQHQADVRYATQGAALSLADDALYRAWKVGADGTAAVTETGGPQ